MSSQFAFWRRKKREGDLDREIRSYLEAETAEQRDNGLAPDDAHYAAQRAFGNTTLIKEDTRAIWRWGLIESLAQDLRYAVRQLKKTPAFAAVVIVTFALGIGANSALFNVTNSVLLKMMPVHDPEQLVLVGVTGPKRPEPAFALPYPAYEYFRDHNQVFSSVLAYANADLTARLGDVSDRVHAQLISGSFSQTLGVSMALGRPIVAADDRLDAAPSVVISFAFWQRQFAGALDVIGRSLRLNNVPFTIIGVANPRFSGVQLGYDPNVYVPISFEPLLNPGSTQLQAKTTWWLHILGRLRFGVSRSQAQANLDQLFRVFLQAAVREAPPDIPQGMRDAFLRQQIVVTDGSAGLSHLRQQFRDPLLVLMSAALLVFFVTCLNLANLLLARGITRRREMAIRLALGAARARLIRQLLTESVLLGAIGGAAGFAIGRAIERLVTARLEESTISFQLSADIRVTLFTAGISLLGGCLFGILPALRASRNGTGGPLKENSRDSFKGPGKTSLVSSLVAAQIVVALVLLSCATLFVRTLQKLESIDRGFTHNQVMLFSVNPAASGYAGSRIFDFYESLKQGLVALPGVRSVSFSFSSPMSGNDSTTMISEFGSNSTVHQNSHSHRNVISPSFFRTMGIPFLAGRDFDSRDNENTPKVAIVNEKFAKDNFDSQSAIGKRLGYGPSQNSGPVEIVGVVADSKYNSLREQHVPMVYLPYRQFPPQQMTFELRVSDESKSLLPAIRHLSGPAVPVTEVTTLAQQVDQSLLQEHLLTVLTACFAGFALLLAGLGLFGLISYRVERRTREIGLRMALGARSSNVLGLVLKDALLPVVAGAALGLPCTLAAAESFEACCSEFPRATPLQC